MGIVLQDPLDPELRPTWFGCRPDSPSVDDEIFMMKPLDHHTPAWFRRRESAIRNELDSLDISDWEWILNYWWRSFADHREYLWAHKGEYKQLLEMLFQSEAARVRDILLYLAEDFWRHCAGWPDLLAVKGGELHFFEVKSSNDRLSEDQIRWFNDNEEGLGLHASVIKVRDAKDA